MSLREGDIEDVRRSMELAGKPIKSDIIRDADGSLIFYKAKGKHVEVMEVVEVE